LAPKFAPIRVISGQSLYDSAKQIELFCGEIRVDVTFTMKKLIMSVLAFGLLSCGAAMLCAQTKKEERKAKKAQPSMAASSETAPKTLIHVITVKWKKSATPEQIQAALDGAHQLPTLFPGIKHVWTKKHKFQGEIDHVIVMEFADAKALADYADSDAQKKWYETYMAVRDSSVTHDVTN
jgi:hypothetical protein